MHAHTPKKDKFDVIGYGVIMVIFWIAVLLLVMIIWKEASVPREMNIAAIPLLALSVIIAAGATSKWKESRSNYGVYFGDMNRAAWSSMQMQDSGGFVYQQFCEWVMEQQAKGEVKVDESTQHLWERWLNSKHREQAQDEPQA